MRIVHITDPHLSSLENVSFRELRGKRLLGYQSWYRKRRHHYKIDTLRRVTAAVQAESADLIIVSGDLVHIGLETELREASEWLATLGTPDEVLVIPGNHDCYHAESVTAMQALFGPYLGIPAAPDLASAYPMLRRIGGVSVIAACTALPTPWWGAFGTLGSDQRRRLGDMLEREREQLRILVLHHPPLPRMATARKALTDADALRASLDTTGPLLVLHGHLHRNQAVTTAQHHIFCTAPASSTRKAKPASYRLFDLTPEANGWHINMALKSLVRDKIVIQARSDWFSGLLDSGKSNEARAQ